MTTEISITSKVYNKTNAKQLGVPHHYYRKRGYIYTNLSGSTPADQYQKLKQIQNTVRVDGSLYTENLGPLTAYKKAIKNPSLNLYGVCWNQMSDQPTASVQKATIPTGQNCSLNNHHNSVTSSRPGCQSPSGIGCDIKHNSYDRYLNRLKGKGPLRRGLISPYFGIQEPFNQAYPIYGNKTIKTNIIDGCDCPITNTNSSPKNIQDNLKIYNNPEWQPYPITTYGFNVGAQVYAIKTGTDYYSIATVISVLNNIYNIQFNDGTIQIVNDVRQLLVYFPCNCGIVNPADSISFRAGFIASIGNVLGINNVLSLSQFIQNSNLNKFIILN